MKNEDYKYKICFSSGGIVMQIIASAIFIAVSIWLYMNNNGVFIFTSLFGLIITALTLYSLYAILFIKVYINEYEFTHTKGPGISKTYKYTDIPEAWISSGRATSGASYYYFNYKTKDGKVHKFMFYSYQSEAADYLLARIKGEEVEDDE